ncbi:hypothetical protein [Fructilactobacillus cliffordii]|uniref:Uncharacterized protein n=1 Tax=Fructilactobacillus cliffordii TaxID=2940299 RepID=A0A9Q8ZWU0_9LACO|nr:hypothetical protein [Fructilactobacillus cliffordii]USS89996.1 hypothetical protein M3M40_07165 [Fructilactobacillus cliffordii]
MATNLIAKSKEKGKKKRSRKRHTVLDLLEYKSIVGPSEFIHLKDDSYCNFLQIPGIGLDSFPDMEFSDITDGFTAFLRQYVYDLTFLTTKFPASTQEQQVYWNQKLYKLQKQRLNSNSDKYRKELAFKEKYIKQALQVIRNVERDLENQEYVCIVFANSQRDLKVRCQDVRQYGGKYLHFYDMDIERKRKLLFKINNMNTPLNG